MNGGSLLVYKNYWWVSVFFVFVSHEFIMVGEGNLGFGSGFHE
jgi:hypothetical protein